MAASTKDKLRIRWTKHAITEVASILSTRPINLDALASLTGRIVAEDGTERIDLRAFPIPESISDCELQAVDFSYGDWPVGHALTSLSANDCLFRQMGIEYSLASLFVDCDFTSSRLIDCQGTPGQVYTRCNFSECQFAKGHFLGCRFEDCRFVCARMPTTEFQDCEFIRCSFTGAAFKRGNLSGSRFEQLRNNFKYLDHETVTPKEYVADPKFPTVELHDTYMIGATFN